MKWNNNTSQTKIVFFSPLSLSRIVLIEKQGQSQEQNGAYAASECFVSRTPFDWFIDSGASESFTDQRQILENFEPVTTGVWTVNGIGGMILEVKGRGNVHIVAEVYLFPIMNQIEP